ncbi:MAG: hypothetical protein IJY46_08705 [Lentisphaeria bacterium]|nr:hypothetical protein [Lentisphaeria bacterium]
MLHDPSAERDRSSFERSPTGGARIAHARFAFRKTKSEKITFSKSNFLPLKKIEKQTIVPTYNNALFFYNAVEKNGNRFISIQ